MSAFPGKDASLAFVTGDFTESGLTDDVSSLSPLQVVALYDWLAFYQRDYQAVGMKHVSHNSLMFGLGRQFPYQQNSVCARIL